MAAMDFPASPTDGQLYPAAPNSEYIYNTDKGAWMSLPTEAAKTITSDIAPVNPKDGDQWFNSIDGCLYLYYVDVDGGQWLQTKNDASFSSTLGPRVDAMEANDNRNVIINGAFDIWQRGTSFTNGGAYTADRWQISTDKTVTVSQQTFTPGTAPVAGYEGTYFMRYATTSTGSYQDLFQKVEDVRTFAGQTVTLSFWAKVASGTLSITPRIEQYFGSGGSSTTYNSFSSQSITTSWQRFTMTQTLPSISGKTIASGNFISVLLFGYGAGTATIDLWGVQLQAGSVATAFHRNAPSLQAELAACQRYYQKSYNTVTAPGTNTDAGSMQFAGATNGGGNTTVPVPLKVQMRSTPSIAFWTQSGTANVWDYERSGAAGTLTANATGIGDGGFRTYVSTGVSFTACATYGHWVATAEL